MPASLILVAMSVPIVHAVFREIHLPLVEPFAISSGVETVRRILLLELVDEEGRSGWSECVAGAVPNYTYETADTAWLAVTEWLVPRILGRRIEKPADVNPLLDEGIRGHQMAKAAIEMGFWGMAAEQAGVSLARYIGGTRDAVATGISVGIQESPQILVEKVGRYLEQGYQKVKIKIMPGKDLEFVQAVREAYGSDPHIMVDANNAYSLEDIDTLKQLDAFNLLMIEQPLAHDDLLRHARLQKHLQTPLCLDESITTFASAEDMIELESGRIINIKPGRVGGFAIAIAIHDLAKAHNMPVWCGGMLESGIGRAYNVALASLPNFTLPGDLSPSRRYWAQDIVTPEWEMDESGFMPVPVDKPGLGVEVDRDRIDDLLVRETVVES